MADNFDLNGKIAMVTGGAGGIGRALSLGLADSGADVVVVSRKLENLERVAEEVRSKGKKALAVSVDVTQEKSVADMVKRTLETFPRIDILINSHGIAIRNPADTFPVDEWQEVIDVNTRGTFLTCQAVGREMIKQGSGKIVNMSSVRGRYGVHNNGAAYCTSRGAIDSLTRTLACEWARHNVLINAIAPCVVETDKNRERLSDPKSAHNFKTSIPLGHWAMPEDIVGPTLFLVSSSSDFITGQIIYIDGGLTTWA